MNKPFKSKKRQIHTNVYWQCLVITSYNNNMRNAELLWTAIVNNSTKTYALC